MFSLNYACLKIVTISPMIIANQFVNYTARDGSKKSIYILDYKIIIAKAIVSPSHFEFLAILTQTLCLVLTPPPQSSEQVPQLLHWLQQASSFEQE